MHRAIEDDIFPPQKPPWLSPEKKAALEAACGYVALMHSSDEANPRDDPYVLGVTAQGLFVAVDTIARHSGPRLTVRHQGLEQLAGQEGLHEDWPDAQDITTSQPDGIVTIVSTAGQVSFDPSPGSLDAPTIVPYSIYGRINRLGRACLIFPIGKDMLPYDPGYAQ